MRRDRAGHHEGTDQVYLERPQPDVFREVVELIVGHKRGGARIVHEHVQLTKVRHRGLNESLAVGFFRDICLHRQCSTTRRLYLHDHCLSSLCRAAIVHYDPRAHPGELSGQGRAHAGAGARDEYHPI